MVYELRVVERSAAGKASAHRRYSAAFSGRGILGVFAILLDAAKNYIQTPDLSERQLIEVVIRDDIEKKFSRLQIDVVRRDDLRDVVSESRCVIALGHLNSSSSSRDSSSTSSSATSKARM